MTQKHSPAKSRGGKRPGAGRPPVSPSLKKIPVTYKLPRWLTQWLREQDMPAAQIIEKALRNQHGLKPPKEAGRGGKVAEE